MVNVTDTQLTNVKHILFGNQKQANVINESVASIVARHLVESGFESALNSEADIMEAIKSTLDKYIESPETLDGKGKMFVMLTAGEQSLANIASAAQNENAIATVVYLGVDGSPKVNYRVHLDVKPAEIERDAVIGDISSKPAFDKDLKGDDKDDTIKPYNERKTNMQPQEAADWLQAKILQVAPHAFDNEFVDEKSKALYYADAYFSMVGLH